MTGIIKQLLSLKEEKFLKVGKEFVLADSIFFESSLC